MLGGLTRAGSRGSGGAAPQEAVLSLVFLTSQSSPELIYRYGLKHFN